MTFCPFLAVCKLCLLLSYCAMYALDTDDWDPFKKKKNYLFWNFSKILAGSFSFFWLTKTFNHNFTKTSINEAQRTESQTYTARHVSIAFIVLSVTPRLKRFLLSYDRDHVWTELAGLYSVCSRAKRSSHKHETKRWQPCWHQTQTSTTAWTD